MNLSPITCYNAKKGVNQTMWFSDVLETHTFRFSEKENHKVLQLSCTVYFRYKSSAYNPYVIGHAGQIFFFYLVLGLLGVFGLFGKNPHCSEAVMKLKFRKLCQSLLGKAPHLLTYFLYDTECYITKELFIDLQESDSQ